MSNSCSLKCKGITLLFFVLMPFSLHAVLAQAATNTTVSAVPSVSSPVMGETFTVNLTISNVQNLYGFDVVLRWNVSVLQMLGVNLRLGVESNVDGVLHEQLPDSQIEISEATDSGEYNIIATSVYPAPSFSGSGNIAIIMFNVTGLGQTKLELESELRDYPAPEEEANPIEHTIVDGSVNAIPEFASVLVIVLFLALITTVVIFSKKQLQNVTPVAPASG